ncbi:acyltransferase family protein [Spongiactinospora sp. TRM90649]|uniref:acyltransferase family protein n=1 Tax=Spongiactinospora sp. TRM90649 TaxID=3031114 RepID=UPI0023F9FC3D|nr:acyltransferase family protein [Spongiactinospora sp. TRM90649]MDF5757234.1 acyltransferase family protein [Spongiactinospora sp. TRM90649]
MTERHVTGSRLRYVDNLRVALTALVVVHHVAVTYGGIDAWYYFEPAEDASGRLLDLMVALDQAFFMGLFFLISGYFTPGALDRKGGRAFFRDRLLRLGVPLLVFLVVLRPLVNFNAYPAVRAATGLPDVPYWLFYLLTWDPGPMWFVEVLLVFSAIYVVYRARGRRSPAGPAATPRAPGLRAVALFTLALAVATFLWRFLVPVGLYVPVLGLPTPAYLPQYAAMFAVGVAAHRRGWLEALPRRAGWAGFAVAGVVTPLLAPFALGRAPGVWQSLALSTWEAVFAVGVSVGLLALFRERLDRQGPVSGFLSRHAYTVYFVHPVVLVGLSLALAGFQAAAIWKFALVCLLALPLCWGFAYLVRSLPYAKRVL